MYAAALHRFCQYLAHRASRRLMMAVPFDDFDGVVEVGQWVQLRDAGKLDGRRGVVVRTDGPKWLNADAADAGRA